MFFRERETERQRETGEREEKDNLCGRDCVRRLKESVYQRNGYIEGDCGSVGVCERERERETDRQTDRQRCIVSERETERQR